MLSYECSCATRVARCADKGVATPKIAPSNKFRCSLKKKAGERRVKPSTSGVSYQMRGTVRVNARPASEVIHRSSNKRSACPRLYLEQVAMQDGEEMRDSDSPERTM